MQLAPGGDALTALVTALKPMQLLLVIDNAEHLLDDLAVMVQALLQGTPGVRLLVTSQVPLRLQGEQVLRLDALAVPEPGSNALGAAQHGARRPSFTERARSADRRFALTDSNVRDVIEICQRLDGLPLALELAAARVPLLGVRGVADRLDDRFKLLAGGQPLCAFTPPDAAGRAGMEPRAAARSPERRVFQQLGVFAGGFTLNLARCRARRQPELDEWALIEALATLTEHSLLSVSANDPPRYALERNRACLCTGAAAIGRRARTRLRTRHAAPLCANSSRPPQATGCR